ncbi:sensor histidine kinase [Nocardioides nitrophenolicus]|uniref:sensor histidine kinase n=1 Tax=Nocardioides nitrophenolicus TaxID=60489 RepID=UPI00195C99C7|nr:HAMP domain-containing sensor histidine kinase [Nocardioides nitrophenolicus]MBM7517768.1 signal transduction histidine kinase [Nocardioides nitrophenolicus]
MEAGHPLTRTLELLAEGVIEFAGFRVAAVSLVADGVLHTVAVVGDDDAAAQLVDQRTPVALLERELAPAEQWGALRFLPADRSGGHLAGHLWTSGAPPLAGADAWDPRDLICGLLRDSAGRLRGVLWVDLPTNGRRPDAAQRATLQMYVRLAERALVTALERDDLEVRVEREHAVAEYRRTLIDVLSHELRGTAAAIAHTVDALRAEPELGAAVEAGLDVVHGGAERLRSVVDDMSALAKLGRADVPLRALPADLAALARESIALHSAEAHGRGVAVDLDATGETVVDGDPEDLGRMIDNLVSNAIKYSEPEGRVVVRVAAEPDGVVLSVSDVGIGIDPADREHVFEEFFRSRSLAVRRRPGAGLGLAIAQRVATLHGGVIRVDSTPGAGTTFTVALPRPGVVRSVG